MSAPDRALAPWGCALLAAPLLACEPPTPPLQWESEHFSYRSETWDRAHTDAMASWLEHHLAVHQRILDLEPPTGQRVHYHHTDADSAAAWCGAPACAVDGTVVSPEFSHGHELIHAETLSTSAATPFFVEGLAHLYGCWLQGGFADDFVPTRDVRALMTTPAGALRGEADMELRMAGMSFLGAALERHGVAALARFLRAVHGLSAIGPIERAYEASFGERLDAAIERWVALGPHPPNRFCQWAAECEYQPASLATGAAQIEHTAAPIEDLPRLFDLSDSPGAVYGHAIAALRDLPEGPRWWAFSAEFPQVRLLPCGGGAPIEYLGRDTRLYLEPAPGGLAVVSQTFAFSGEPELTTLTITEPTGPVLTERCEEPREAIDVEVFTPEALLRLPLADQEACAAGCDRWVTLDIADGSAAHSSEIAEACAEDCARCEAGLERLNGDGTQRQVRLRFATPTSSVYVGAAFPL